MTTLHEAARLALDALENHTAIKHPQQMHYRDTAIEALRQALEQPEQEPECSTHPDAPHGFNRDASHNLRRYVCDCEGWEPPDDDAAWARHLKEPMSEKRVHEGDTLMTLIASEWAVSEGLQTTPEKHDVVAQEVQPEQEPVAWVLHRELFWPYEYEVISENGDNAIPLYTAPPKREWVGLTDEEMLALIANEPHPLGSRTAIINAVERLLKEKNS